MLGLQLDADEATLADQLGRALSRRGRTLLVLDNLEQLGTDCPAVDHGRVTAALAALQRVPCVLGPARDGGYCLIGTTYSLPVFTDIAWGTDSVLATTRMRLRGGGLVWEDLPVERDIDTIIATAQHAVFPTGLRWARCQALRVRGRILTSIAIRACQAGLTVRLAEAGSGDDHSERFVVCSLAVHPMYTYCTGRAWEQLG